MRRDLIEQICPDSLGRPINWPGSHAEGGAVGSKPMSTRSAPRTASGERGEGAPATSASQASTPTY